MPTVTPGTMIGSSRACSPTPILPVVVKLHMPVTDLVPEAEDTPLNLLVVPNPVEYLRRSPVHRTMTPPTGTQESATTRTPVCNRYAEGTGAEDRQNDRVIQRGEALDRQALGVLEELVPGNEVERPEVLLVRTRR